MNSVQTLRKEFLVRVPFVFWLSHQTRDRPDPDMSGIRTGLCPTQHRSLPVKKNPPDSGYLNLKLILQTCSLLLTLPFCILYKYYSQRRFKIYLPPPPPPPPTRTKDELKKLILWYPARNLARTGSGIRVRHRSRKFVRQPGTGPAPVK